MCHWKYMETAFKPTSKVQGHLKITFSGWEQSLRSGCVFRSLSKTNRPLGVGSVGPGQTRAQGRARYVHGIQ